MGYGGADLSTMDPNPNVVNYGDNSNYDAISNMGNVLGQWGATIASIVTGTPATVTNTGASVGYQTPIVYPQNNNRILVILLIVAGVIYVVGRK